MASTPQAPADAAATTAIAAVSWTGGKDCNLALLHATRDPSLDVRYLICFRPEETAFRAHPIPFMQAQADSLGLQLLFVHIPDTDDYMQAYVDGLRRVRDEYNIKVIATGDMDLVGTMERNWIERCCEKAGGMRCCLPLWKTDRRGNLDALLREGFEIIFTCVKSPFFDGSWINRVLDEDAVKEMQQIIAEQGAKEGLEKPLDLGGERGEYHTMCVNGPFYQKRVEIEANPEPHREDTGGTNWKGNIHNADSVWTISLKEK